MKVRAGLVHTERENVRGIPVASVEVTCGRCGAFGWAYGTGTGSVRRCLAATRGWFGVGEQWRIPRPPATRVVVHVNRPRPLFSSAVLHPD